MERSLETLTPQLVAKTALQHARNLPDVDPRSIGYPIYICDKGNIIRARPRYTTGSSDPCLPCLLDCSRESGPGQPPSRRLPEADFLCVARCTLDII